MPEHEQTPKPVAPPQPQPRPALRPAETPRPANWVQALGRQPAASLFALETGAVRDEMGADESAPAADESRPAAHEDMALLPATLGPRQRAPLMIQRAADLDGLTPESDETAADAIAPAGLLVADDAASGPGQMTRSAFLAALRDAVCAGVEAELEGTLWSAMGCPYVEYWFGYYQQQSADHIERALRRYVPEASSATSAEGYIPLAVARVRRGVATWRDTGQVTEVPAGLPTNLPGLPPSAPPAAAPTNQGENDENVARKADATATPAHSPARVRQQLGPGQPLEGGVRNRMEPALGADLGRVRLHTDGKAAGLARGLGARAFAVGNHVAFGAGHYQPGTLIGDALLAHELAHVVQQSAAQTPASATSSSDERSLEDDADHTAMGAVLRLWGHARALAGRTMPALRAGLRLQSCGMSVKEKEQAAKDLLAIITDPMANEADIIKKMEALGSDGAEVLMLTPPFDHKSDDGRIRTFAGTEAGQRVLAKGTSILHNGDVVARVRADAIDKILAEFTPTTPPTVKPDEQTALDRINKAIDADSRKPEYSKSTPPLRLPVTRLNFGTEMFGGVYYNPHMSGNDAGRTRLRSLKNPETSNVAYMLVYIELGPNALTNTDEYLRSVMWHEFMHYQQYMRFRGPEASKTADTKALESESASTSKDKPNAEIEATSMQLVAYFDTFTDAEVGDVLWYLAQHMGHILLNADFKKAAIDRIVAALAGDRAKQDRLLKIIGKQKKDIKTNLADLETAIKANLAPKPKGKGKK